MDDRVLRIFIGLALESVIAHHGDTRDLLSLRSDPNGSRLRELHHRLIVSEDHFDREAAIWLEPALDMGPLGSNPQGLTAEMREMESLLLWLTSRAAGARGEVNLWMNLVANAAQFLLDGFWIDAKIMLSRALSVSREPSVEALKADPSLRYEVDTFQRATASYFEEAKGYPVGLSIPSARLEPALAIQDAMLEIMLSRFRPEGADANEFSRQSVHRLSAAVRYMLEERGELEKAKRELALASEYIIGCAENSREEAGRERLLSYGQEIEKTLKKL